jgi:hypothetical protein
MLDSVGYQQYLPRVFILNSVFPGMGFLYYKLVGLLNSVNPDFMSSLFEFQASVFANHLLSHRQLLNVQGYVVLNRPWAFVQWLEKATIEEE